MHPLALASDSDHVLVSVTLCCHNINGLSRNLSQLYSQESCSKYQGTLHSHPSQQTKLLSWNKLPKFNNFKPAAHSTTYGQNYKGPTLKCTNPKCMCWFRNQSGLTKHFNTSHCHLDSNNSITNSSAASSSADIGWNTFCRADIQVSDNQDTSSSDAITDNQIQQETDNNMLLVNNSTNLNDDIILPVANYSTTSNTTDSSLDGIYDLNGHSKGIESQNQMEHPLCNKQVCHPILSGKFHEINIL